MKMGNSLTIPPYFFFTDYTTLSQEGDNMPYIFHLWITYNLCYGFIVKINKKRSGKYGYYKSSKEV